MAFCASIAVVVWGGVGVLLPDDDLVDGVLNTSLKKVTESSSNAGLWALLCPPVD